MKEMIAEIKFQDGSVVKTIAIREKTGWIIGGDIAQATREVGGTIFIISKGNIYLLRGNRLIFQDFAK